MPNHRVVRSRPHTLSPVGNVKKYINRDLEYYDNP